MINSLEERRAGRHAFFIAEERNVLNFMPFYFDSDGVLLTFVSGK